VLDETSVIALTVAPPVSLYWIVSVVLENCSKGTITLINEPERILLMRVTLHTISVLESAVVTDLSAVPVHTLGVRV